MCPVLQELCTPSHKNSKTSLPWLDFLRSLALLLVIGGHCLEWGYGGLAYKTFYWGWTGVDLFFILSGYLIGFQLWRELRSTGSIDLRKFFVRRSLRIWPLYFFVLGIYAACDFLTHRPMSRLWADAAFVSNYFLPLSGRRGMVAFYRGTILSSLSRHGQSFSRHLPVKRLVWVPILWLAALPLLRHWEMFSHPGKTPNIVIYSPLHTHSDGLAIGVLIALLAVLRPGMLTVRRSALLLSLVMVVLGVATRLVGGVDFSYGSLALIYGGVTVSGLHSQMANRFARWSGFHILSRLSFGMYLNHLVIIIVLAPYVRPHIMRHNTNPLLFVFGFGGVIFASNI